MRKQTKKSLKRKLDKVFSEFVRKGGKCVRCGKMDNLQAAHIFSRSNLSVRWDIMNALCLCAGCHFYAHLNPVFWTEFVKLYLGDYNYEQLKQKAVMTKKWTVEELQGYLKTLEKL